MRFLTTDGTGSNNINSLNKSDLKMNARFINILKTNGFSKFYSDKGTISGSNHSDGHADHLHGER